MRKIFLILLVPILYSCVNESGARMGLFTAKSPVAVTIKGDVFAAVSYTHLTLPTMS